MTAFSDMLDDGKSAPPPPRRRWLLPLICLGTFILVTAMTATGLAIAHRLEARPTAAHAAELGCKTTNKVLKLGLMVETAYKLPDVGKPRGIIVVPECFNNTQVPTSDLSYHIKDVDVYIMMSNEQLVKLFAADGGEVEDNVPYGVTDAALDHLVSPELRRQIDSDPTHVGVTYMVTSGPMPNKRVDKERGYDYLIAPFDALTDTHYDPKLPFTTRHPLYDAGDPIVIRGSGK
jgi:hypothetical protein